jgi:hypothetical protein
MYVGGRTTSDEPWLGDVSAHDTPSVIDDTQHMHHQSRCVETGPGDLEPAPTTRGLSNLHQRQLLNGVNPAANLANCVGHALSSFRMTAIDRIGACWSFDVKLVFPNIAHTCKCGA